jgi:hypothetical protein
VQPQIALIQRTQPSLPWIAVDSGLLDGLLGIDPLTVRLAREDREWTVLWWRRVGEEELEELLDLTVEEATDAVDDSRPVGMDVDRIRLAST